MRRFVSNLVLAVFVVGGAGNVLGSPGVPPTPEEYAALDRLTASSKPVEFSFVKTPVAEVFHAVSQASGVEIELKGLPEQKMTIRTGKVSLKDALVQIARANDLSYEVLGPEKLVVRSKKTVSGRGDR